MEDFQSFNYRNFIYKCIWTFIVSEILLHYASVGGDRHFSEFPTFFTWHTHSFFHLLSFGVFMSSILSSLYLLLLIFMLFFHSQKKKKNKKHSASHRKIKQHSAFRLPTARDDPNFNFHFDFHFHFGSSSSSSPRWLRMGGETFLLCDIRYTV